MLSRWTILGGLLAFVLLLALLHAGVIPVAGLVFLIFLPPAIVFALRAFRGNPGTVLLVAVLLLFLASASFRYREYADKSIDFQIVLKLLTISAMGGLAIFWLPIALNARLRSLAGLWVAFLVYQLFTALYSQIPTVAFVSAASIFLCFLFLLTFAGIFGREKLIELVILAGALLFVGSAVAYFAFPEVGHTLEWYGDLQRLSSRMRGITVAAVALGISTAYWILLGWIYRDELTPRARAVYTVVLPLAVACLILSNARMALVALTLALFFWSLLRGKVAMKLSLAAVAAVIGIAFYLSLTDTILQAVSRSGRVDEITSFTGRTEIWRAVIALWWQHPIFGWGYESAIHILPSHPALFRAAAHTHNMYLDILFSGGVVGLAIFAVCLGMSIAYAIWTREMKVLPLFVFFFVLFLTEAPISGIVAFPSISFYCTVVLLVQNGVTRFQDAQSMGGSSPTPRAVDFPMRSARCL